MKRTRSKMKVRTMNRNNLKDPRREDFNYNTIALKFFGFFNETTLSWQLKHLKLTTSSTIERESHFKIMF